MHSRLIPRWTVAALLTIPAFGLGMAVSASATASSTTSFYGCLYKGTLSKVSTSSHTCKPGKLESWNAVGPQGGQGAQGVQGTHGVQGTQGIQGVQGVQGVPGPTSLSALSGTPCTIQPSFFGPPVTSQLGVYVNPTTGATDMVCLGGSPSLVVSTLTSNGAWGGFSGTGLQPGAEIDIYASHAATPSTYGLIGDGVVLADGTTGASTGGFLTCGDWAGEYIVSTTYAGNTITSPTQAATC